MINGNSLLMVLLLISMALSIAPIPKSLAQANSDSVPGLIWATWGGNLNDSGSDVASDRSGNIYVIGSTSSFGSGSTDAVLLKYNANGTLLWARTWGGASSEVGKAVAIDPDDGRVYIAGDTQSFGGGSAVFLVKFDPEGDLIWQQIYVGTNTSHVADIAVDYSGNAFLTGETISSLRGDADLFLLKTNIYGSLVWQRSWGGNGTDHGNGLVLDSTGNVFVTGFSQSLGPNRAGILLKFSSIGSLLLQKAWNGTKDEEGVKVAIDSAGAIYLAGNTSSYGAGGVDALLMKLNSTGGALWERTWGGNGTDAALGIGVGSQGNIFVSGYTNQAQPCRGAVPFLLKLNASLIPSSLVMGSQYCYYPSSKGLASGLAIDGDGNAIATGFTNGFEPNFSVGNKTLGYAMFTLKTPQISTGTPKFQVEVPNGAVSSPSGSMDQFPYYAHNEILLLKYFVNPTTFAIKYEHGSFYGGGKPMYENKSIQIGTYIASVGIPICCIEVASWNSSGGVTIVGRNIVYGFEIVVFTVTGPGVLQFPDYRLEEYPHQPHSALPLGLLLAAVMLVLPVVFSLRRRQTKRAHSKIKIRFQFRLRLR